MKLPNHLMVSDTDGHLYDTRKPEWFKTPVRRDYRRGFREIETTAQLKAVLRAPYTWPGGYEIVFVTDDGAILCADCVKKNLRSCMDSTKNKLRDGWRIVGTAYEAVSAECTREMVKDADEQGLITFCDHCGKEFGELA